MDATLPSFSASRFELIGSILKNPIYAGTYVYGRRPSKMLMSDGPIVKRTAPRVPPEECRVFIRDHHDAYISWEEFE
jgi:Recombinase